MTPTTTLSLPPPLELRAGDRLVGWIQGDLVRFRGFARQHDAGYAAALAHQAMLRRLARGNRETASPAGANATADGRSVGSVLRSAIDGLSGTDAGEFAFEIRVPPPVDELRMRGMAYVMYRALLSSGVAWPLVRPETAPEELTVAATRAAENENESTNGITSGAFAPLRRLFGRASGELGLPRAGARTFAPFVARLAGVRRSARLALALLLATGAGDRRDEAVEGRQS